MTPFDDIRVKLIAILGALVVLLLAGVLLYNKGIDVGVSREQVKTQAAELKRLGDIAELTYQNQLDNAEIQRRQIEANLKVTADHEKELVQVRASAAADRAAVDRRGGLRIPAAVCDRPATPTEAAGASGPDDAAAATVRIPRETEERLWALADAADEVTAQARACQAWIRAQGFYGNPVNSNPVLLDRMVDAENPQPKEPHD